MAEKVIYSVLSNNAGVAAAVSTRIYPDMAVRNATLPYIVYMREATEQWQSGDGYGGISTVTFTFECYATTRVSANAIRDKVRIALDDLAATTVSTQTVDQATSVGGSDETFIRTTSDGKEEPVYMASIDFELFVREAVS